MSMNNLTIDGEFRYIVQWFNEWSELQRDDFVPLLVKYITDTHTNEDDDNDKLTTVAAATPVNMNGLPNDLQLGARPLSLFQCRVKLFNQWNRRWPPEFKEKLHQKISEIDVRVDEKIKLALNSTNMGNLLNGYSSNEEKSLKENAENVVEIGTVVLNDPMTEVLNNETSVDDIETNEDINNTLEQPLFNNAATNATTATERIHTVINNIDNNDVTLVAVGNSENDECSSNTRYNNTINERDVDPVEQVVQMQNLQINEERAEKEKDREDVISTVEQNLQQQPSIIVTVNPIVVAQAITANAEVPLVV